DDGLGDVADRVVQRFHVHRALARSVAALAAFFLVAARAERFVAGAGQYGDPDRPVPARVEEGVSQFGDGDCAERVADLRTIDRDPGDAVFFLVEDVGVRHG